MSLCWLQSDDFDWEFPQSVVSLAGDSGDGQQHHSFSAFLGGITSSIRRFRKLYTPPATGDPGHCFARFFLHAQGWNGGTRTGHRTYNPSSLIWWCSLTCVLQNSESHQSTSCFAVLLVQLQMIFSVLDGRDFEEADPELGFRPGTLEMANDAGAS